MCTLCPQGQYSSLPAQSQCTVCAAGTTTLSTGATVCVSSAGGTAIVNVTVTLETWLSCSQLASFVNTLRSRLSVMLSVPESAIIISVVGCTQTGRRLTQVESSVDLEISVSVSFSSSSSAVNTLNNLLDREVGSLVTLLMNGTITNYSTSPAFVSASTSVCTGFACPQGSMANASVSCPTSCTSSLCCVNECQSIFANFSTSCLCPSLVTSPYRCTGLCNRYGAGSSGECKTITDDLIQMCAQNVGLGGAVAQILVLTQQCVTSGAPFVSVSVLPLVSLLPLAVAVAFQ